MIHGPDPSIGRRAEYAGRILQEVLLQVGDSLCSLYGRQSGFYFQQLAPLLKRMSTVLATLDYAYASGRQHHPHPEV